LLSDWHLHYDVGQRFIRLDHALDLINKAVEMLIQEVISNVESFPGIGVVAQKGK